MVDVNVVLDMAMSARPQHVAALQLLSEIEAGDVKAYLCATSCKDIYRVLTRYMGEPGARLYVKALAGVVEICAVDRDVCLQALDSDEPDFEDGLVRACAEDRRVDYLVSRDEAAFASSTIKRLDAAAFVEREGEWVEAALPAATAPPAL